MCGASAFVKSLSGKTNEVFECFKTLSCSHEGEKNSFFFFKNTSLIENQAEKGEENK